MLLMENVQECEARIFVEEALAGQRISGELAGRGQKLLDERADWCRIVHAAHHWGACVTLEGDCGEGSRARARALYALAAEVAAKLGRK